MDTSVAEIYTAVERVENRVIKWVVAVAGALGLGALRLASTGGSGGSAGSAGSAGNGGSGGGGRQTIHEVPTVSPLEQKQSEQNVTVKNNTNRANSTKVKVIHV